MEPHDPMNEPVDFDEVIDRVIDGLPAAFAERLGSVAIVVDPCLLALSTTALPFQLRKSGSNGIF